jgi:adhesin transport system membrane fusion protein
MDRTSVRSPVDGTVKRVFVTTIGEAVGAGKEMLEIVPREDTLLIEAKVLPQDIAFLYPGQAAEVKITAYDFSIYGSMPGVVEHISADAITDEQENLSYYLIKVRTDEASLKGRDGKDLPIIAGMVAEVDVLTGKKTVLEYLLKPILKSKSGTLNEQ